MYCGIRSWIAAALIAAAGAASAAEGFAPGWRLDPEASKIAFQSVKNGTKVETSGFATFEGAIDVEGKAEVRIMLDSVDTGIDLRNVRMRFLFFETFLHPEARITASLDPAALAALPTERRVSLPVVYTVDLHGVTKEIEIETAVTLVTDDLVLVSGSSVVVPVEMFDLEEGLLKLQDAAKVTITPAGTISFDLIFKRDAGGAAPEVQSPAADPAPAEAPAAGAALETEGEFSKAECEGRFEIISRAGAINFGSGSSALDPSSGPFLRTITEIVERCPSLSIRIAGHTDSDGGEDLNQRLSETRAQSVMSYLALQGVEVDRLSAVGFGESRPVAPNDTARNKRLNRRIEFMIVE